MKNALAFICVGTVFVMLFLPYIIWKSIEARINGLLSETVIVSRLGNMALSELFRDDTEPTGSEIQGSS